mgnify:CR=1 FL=1
MKTKWVSCGDWMDTWGLGTNKIGKLSKGDLLDRYVWKGLSQGRHGQVYRKTYTVVFTYNSETGEIITDGNGSLPTGKHVVNAINQLQ